MDQVKIGKFIASCRKDAGMTQAALAEMLGITDRAVSKWENGHSLPDASIMPQLCELLGVSIGELFAGERISDDDYKETSDALLLEMKRQEELSERETGGLDWLRQYLTENEKVLYVTKPLTNHIMGRRDMYLIQFSIIWFIFALSWELGVIASTAGSGGLIMTPMALFGLPFVLIGLYFTFGRFIHKKQRRRNTVYVFTDGRIFRHLNNDTEVLSLDNLPPMHIENYKDGSGRIVFAAQSEPWEAVEIPLQAYGWTIRISPSDRSRT